MAKKGSNKGKLSAKDFEFFKTNIFKSDAELADILNRTEKFIQETRKKVYPNKKAGKWTNTELEILTNHKDSMSVDELSRFLNRSQKNVITKLESLNEKQEEDIKPIEVQDVKEEIIEAEETVQNEASTCEEHVSVKVEYRCELCGKAECVCVPKCEFCGESPCKCEGPLEESCCKDGACQCKVEEKKAEEPKKSLFQKFLSFLKFW